IGSSGGMGAFMTGRGTANLLTRTTAVLATLFMLLSLALALLNRGTMGAGRTSVLEPPPPAGAPATGAPALPAGPRPAAPNPAAPPPNAPPQVPTQ
ncbi:MAG: preprotein translocase subunit SecG, partial [Alphaproteobacteria bacterium]|nr:preprotein translocase subunit SecG [Alphaproteobacteria bacterium]